MIAQAKGNLLSVLDLSSIPNSRQARHEGALAVNANIFGGSCTSQDPSILQVRDEVWMIIYSAIVYPNAVNDHAVVNEIGDLSY